MNGSLDKEKPKTYTREEYWRIFFPTKTHSKKLEADTPYEMGELCASKAVNHLKKGTKKISY